VRARAESKRSVTVAAPMAHSERLERALPLLLFAGGLALYFAGAARLADTAMHERDNVFFRSDTERAFRDLTGRWDADHRRTSTHPLFVLIHHPLGRGLTHALRAAGVPPREARERASALLTGAAGGLAAALAFRLLRTAGVSLAFAGFFSAILAASAAHWAFASIPETWIFSALSLAWLALETVRRPSAPEWRFQLPAVYAIGVVTTNLVPVGVLAWLRHALRGAAFPAAPARALRSTALALGLVAALALVQQALYPTTTLFFLPNSVTKETKWVKWTHWLERPGPTVQILGRSLLLDNVLAPAPYRTEHEGLPMASIEEARRAHYRARWPAVALWALVLAAAGVGALRGALWRPLGVAALGLLAFHFAFHSFFGNDRFLYAAGWTLFTVLAVALGFEAAVPRARAPRAAACALLAAFLLLQLGFNWRFLGELRDAAGPGPRALAPAAAPRAGP